MSSSSGDYGFEYDSVEDSSGGASLLHDIEAISKALYLDKNPPRGQSNVASKSTGIMHVQDLDSTSNLRFFGEESLRKDKKSSIWNWKPLKALTHIRNRQFNCCFFLHVHSVQGLPPSFNEFSLCVHWKRKQGFQTCPVRVHNGMAKFEETLMHRCCVYGCRRGPRQLAKYKAKHFLLYASVVEAPGLDLGKHWVDLTKLLPLTFEELEDDKSLGKWSTGFKLSGWASGATLNVSFGFLVIADHSVQLTNHLNVPELLNLSQKRFSSVRQPVQIFNPLRDGNWTLGKTASTPGFSDHGSDTSSGSTDSRTLQGISPNPGLGLSTSINFLYDKIAEMKTENLAEIDLLSERVVPLKTKPKPFPEFEDNDIDETEFSIIEKGIESTEEQVKLEGSAAQMFDVVEIDETSTGINVGLDFKTEINSKDEIHGDHNHELHMEELGSAFFDLSGIASHLKFQPGMSNFLEQEDQVEVRSNNDGIKMARSYSFDDVTESVANDFLSMLEMEHETESPRERLLRQFEEEVSATCNFAYDFNALGKQPEFMFASQMNLGEKDISEDFDLAVGTAKKEPKRTDQSLKSRRNAKALEDLETKALMQDWGLNEETFKCSPRHNSGGFGSPIYFPPLEEQLKLPPLGEGLGPSIRVRGGGFLRSMSPLLFRNADNAGSLTLQVSNPVVLPAEMGTDIMEVLHYLALVGIEDLAMQVNKLMPIENITGKKLQKIAWDDPPRKGMHEREESMRYSLPQDYDGLGSNPTDGEMVSDLVSLEDLAPLAMEKIEVLSMEGLRIQSGMPSDEASSCFSSDSVSETLHFDANELLGMSLKLDEWIKLDAGILDDEEHTTERISKILAAYQAKYTDLIGGKCGLLGNNVMVALRVQLRDPLRNYEPISLPMIAIIQAERVFFSSSDSARTEREETQYASTENGKDNKGEGSPEFKFKITEVHLTGFTTLVGGSHGTHCWGTTIQRQAGSRWLFASGMSKTQRSPISRSKALVRFVPQPMIKEQPRDTLWSISSFVDDFTVAKPKGWPCPHSHIRNPDVAFPRELIQL